MNEDKPERMPNTPPFVRFVCSAIPMVFDDSLSYYEALCALWKYVQGMTDVINNNATLEEEYILKFNELKTFVDTYFDNLDVQEEINNKLDQMAESGELAELIEKYYEGNIQVIFPLYGIDGTDTLGDCSIIKNGDKSLMIDTFSDVSEPYAKIRDALYHAHISTLTYLVITHYHADHIGNVLNLLNDGYLAGCTVYLPRVSQNFPALNGSAIKNALELANVTWIEIDNQTFTLGDDVTVKMLNGSQDDYDYYDSIEDQTYNDYSVVCDVRYRDKKLLFTGDLEHKGCEHILDEIDSNYDLLKDCHHGYILNAPDFCAKVNPDWVIIPASAGMVYKNYEYGLINSVYWVRKSKNVALQGYQDEEIVLDIDITGIKANSGIYFVNSLECKASTDYYVDYQRADEIRNGSYEHPFKNLAEAMVFLPKNGTTLINIQVNSLPVTNNTCFVEGFKNLIIRFNNDIAYNNNVTIESCQNVQVINLKQTSGKVTINNSDAVLTSFSNNVGGEAINVFHSKLAINGSLDLVINTEDAINIRTNSHVTIDTTSSINLTYSEGTTKRFINSYNSVLYMGDNTVNYLKALPFSTKIMSVASLNKTTMSENTKILRALYSNEDGTFTTGSLKEEATPYKVLSVEYKDNLGYRQIVRMRRYNEHAIASIVPNSTTNTLYVRSATITFSGTTFTLSRNCETAIGANGTTVSAGNAIKIINIFGEGGDI